MWGNSSPGALASRFARLVEQLGGDTAAAKAMGQQRDLLAATELYLAETYAVPLRVVGDV